MYLDARWAFEEVKLVVVGSGAVETAPLPYSGLRSQRLPFTAQRFRLAPLFRSSLVDMMQQSLPFDRYLQVCRHNLVLVPVFGNAHG